MVDRLTLVEPDAVDLDIGLRHVPTPEFDRLVAHEAGRSRRANQADGCGLTNETKDGRNCSHGVPRRLRALAMYGAIS